MPETSKTLTQQKFHDKLAVFLTDGPHMLEAHNSLQFHDAEQREELKRTKAALEIAEKTMQDYLISMANPHMARPSFTAALARIERAKNGTE